MSFTLKAAALKAAILAAVASLALASPASAQTQWIMASGYPENNFMTQNLRKWVEDVEKEHRASSRSRCTPTTA